MGCYLQVFLILILFLISRGSAEEIFPSFAFFSVFLLLFTLSLSHVFTIYFMFYFRLLLHFYSKLLI